MKNKLLTALAVLMAIVLVFSSAMLIHQKLKERESAESNDLAHELVHIPDPQLIADPESSVSAEATPEEHSGELPFRDAYAQALADTELFSLREVNSDVIGWIEIPGTRISYPLLQTDNNSYYLSCSWQKRDNPAGSIFIEYQNSPDFSDFNTLIYGHRMNSGDMFGTLYMFSRQEYADAHPRIYIVDDSGCRVYDIFAACEVSADSGIYAIDFSDSEQKQAYIAQCLEQSHITTGITPEADDTIITLSTCSRSSGKNYRYIVQAIHVGTVLRDASTGQELS